MTPLIKAWTPTQLTHYCITTSPTLHAGIVYAKTINPDNMETQVQELANDDAGPPPMDEVPDGDEPPATCHAFIHSR